MLWYCYINFTASSHESGVDGKDLIFDHNPMTVKLECDLDILKNVPPSQNKVELEAKIKLL